MAEVRDDQVEEVWQMQKEPLSASTTWATHSVAVQTDGGAWSPVPNTFKPNVGPVYVPFHIVGRDGHTIPAKYIKCSVIT